MNKRRIDAIKKFKSGEQLYQQRARNALPILVQQAMANEKIYYGDLAKELDMPNARNLNDVLDCIGNAILELNKLLPAEDKIPLINGIVVNQQTGLPGDSVHFIREKLDPRQKEARVNKELADVFSYGKWSFVLNELGLKMPDNLGSRLIESTTHQGKGGESVAHKRLKKYIADHPEIVGLKKSLGPGETEIELPSGDTPDVLFQNSKSRIAVEVKSRKSNENDLKRGLFQCVKYRAILKACRSVEIGSYEADALLAIEGELTKDLIRIKNTLGVEVFENIEVEETS